MPTPEQSPPSSDVGARTILYSNRGLLLVHESRSSGDGHAAKKRGMKMHVEIEGLEENFNMHLSVGGNNGELPKEESPKEEVPKDEVQKDEASRKAEIEELKEETTKEVANEDTKETAKEETTKEEEVAKEEATKVETPKLEVMKDEIPKEEVHPRDAELPPAKEAGPTMIKAPTPIPAPAQTRSASPSQPPHRSTKSRRASTAQPKPAIRLARHSSHQVESRPKAQVLAPVKLAKINSGTVATRSSLKLKKAVPRAPVQSHAVSSRDGRSRIELRTEGASRKSTRAWVAADERRAGARVKTEDSDVFVFVD